MPIFTKMALTEKKRNLLEILVHLIESTVTDYYTSEALPSTKLQRWVRKTQFIRHIVFSESDGQNFFLGQIIETPESAWKKNIIY